MPVARPIATVNTRIAHFVGVLSCLPFVDCGFAIGTRTAMRRAIFVLGKHVSTSKLQR